jgi:hypothetical protein
VIWEPFILALVLGIIVSAGLYFAYLWPSVEPAEPGESAPAGEPTDRSEVAGGGAATSGMATGGMATRDAAGTSTADTSAPGDSATADSAGTDNAAGTSTAGDGASRAP